MQNGGENEQQNNQLSQSGQQSSQNNQQDQSDSGGQIITTARGANANENSERKALTEKFREEKEN